MDEFGGTTQDTVTIYWAGDGCSTAGTAYDWTAMSAEDTATVRCCSGTGTCDSDPGGTCLPQAATFTEAVAACESQQMRLCTRQELEDNKCCSTGCGYDGNLVWSSTTTEGAVHVESS